MKYNYYYLCEDESIIRLYANRRPSLNTVSLRGTWVVQEYYNNKWSMPCCPEITWTRLNQLSYIGKTKV